MALPSLWGQARWLLEDRCELQQQFVQEVRRGRHEHRVAWGRWCRCPKYAAPVPDEAHCAAAEIPEDWSQRLQPLDSEQHIIGPQGEAIAVDVEVFLPNGDLQVGVAAGAGQTIPICHCDAQTGPTLQMDLDASHRVSVDEVMRGARVEQRCEGGARHQDDDLHCSR
jgi:hypothetical protein